MRIALVVIAVFFVLLVCASVIPFLMPIDWLRENGYANLAMTTEWSRRDIAESWRGVWEIFGGK